MEGGREYRGHSEGGFWLHVGGGGLAIENDMMRRGEGPGY